MTAAQVILVVAQPRRAADGVAETVRLAGGGNGLPYDQLGTTDWLAGVARLPTIVAGLEFKGGELGTGSLPQAAELEFAPALQSVIDRVAGYYWGDAVVTVRVGAEGGDPPVSLAGTVLDATTSETGSLKLVLADPAAGLKKGFPADGGVGRYAGTGGLEGPIEWEGKFRRRIWGRVWNLAGECIDKANNVYAYSDPLRPIGGFFSVYDMGAPAASMTTLGWQGSAAATFAALQAAVAPQGGGVACPSLAMVKWWTTPGGTLTADVAGEIGTGYVDTAPEIARALVQEVAGPAFAAGTVAWAAAARDMTCGWVVSDESTNISAMLDELLGNVSLLWVLDAGGEIVLREWAWGASAATVESSAVVRRQAFKPLASRKIGYRRNETQMARGDLAAIVLATELAYLDGTPIENLKPAQYGATNGAVTGVNLTDGSGTTLFDTMIKNLFVSIGANGTLAGGGGGQVTIGGLGFLGDLNATFGAIWNSTLTGRPINLAALLGSEGINNAGVAIGSNGALSGAGGGQVTIGGLGYAGDLNATFGAVWAVSLSGRPSNLAALSGSEAVNNAGVSIGSNGTLAGAGGGQVTIGGLGYAGDLNATFGAVWSVSLSGRPSNLAALSGSEAVNNAGVSMGSNGALAGAGGGQVTIGGLGYAGDLNATFGAVWSVSLSGRPSNLAALSGSEGVNNAGVSIGSNGTLAGAGGGQVTIGGLGYGGDLNATFGAVWSVSLSGRPDELTDGRVVAALDVFGNVNGNRVGTASVLDGSMTGRARTERATAVTLTNLTTVEVVAVSYTRSNAGSAISIETEILFASSDDLRGTIYIYRDAVLLRAVAPYMNGAGGTFRIVQPLSVDDLDAPVGTAVTYRVYFNRNGGGSTVQALAGTSIKAEEFKK